MDNLDQIDIDLLKLWTASPRPYTSHFDSKRKVFKIFSYAPNGECEVRIKDKKVFVGDMETAVKVYNEL